jgi:hypothetical protein
MIITIIDNIYLNLTKDQDCRHGFCVVLTEEIDEILEYAKRDQRKNTVKRKQTEGWWRNVEWPKR